MVTDGVMVTDGAALGADAMQALSATTKGDATHAHAPVPDSDY
jgi:hypothetical protein